jgi:gas vesicle protein GvpL/GvpF
MFDAPLSARFDGGRYVYGVLRHEDIQSRELRGLFEESVRYVERDGLAAAVSTVERAVPGRREDLLTHFRVLEELAAGATVLPLRFGTVFDSDDEVALELLVRRRPDLERLLIELYDLVELSVRGMYEEEFVLAEILRENPDIRSLRERTRNLPEDASYYDRIRLGELVARALEEKRERDAEAVIASLSPLAIAVDIGMPTTEWIALSASFLVRRDRVKRFEKEVAALQQARDDRMQLGVTGSLPPYSFVSVDETAGWARESEVGDDERR